MLGRPSRDRSAGGNWQERGIAYSEDGREPVRRQERVPNMTDREEIHAAVRRNALAFRAVREELLAKYGHGFAVFREQRFIGFYSRRSEATAFAAKTFEDGLYSIHELREAYRIGSAAGPSSSR